MKRIESIATMLLLALGCLSMLGAILQSDAIKGIGIMSGASPLPLVFSKFKGVENFSSDYYMEVLYQDGTAEKFKVTADIYDRANGPYNRRNPYGAVLAYGPMLTKPHELILRDEIMQYASCGEGSFMREIGLLKPISSINVLVKSKTIAKPEWQFSVNCLLGAADVGGRDE